MFRLGLPLTTVGGRVTSNIVNLGLLSVIHPSCRCSPNAIAVGILIIESETNGHHESSDGIRVHCFHRAIHRL